MSMIINSSHRYHWGTRQTLFKAFRDTFWALDFLKALSPSFRFYDETGMGKMLVECKGVRQVALLHEDN